MIIRDHHFFDLDFARSVLRIFSVTAFSAVAGFLAVHFLPLGLFDQGFSILVKLTIITGVVFTVHTLVSSAFDFEESKIVIDKVKNIVLRPIRIQ